MSKRSGLAHGILKAFTEPRGLFEQTLRGLVADWQELQQDPTTESLSSVQEFLETALAQVVSARSLLRLQGGALPGDREEVPERAHAEEGRFLPETESPAREGAAEPLSLGRSRHPASEASEPEPSAAPRRLFDTGETSRPPGPSTNGVHLSDRDEVEELRRRLEETLERVTRSEPRTPEATASGRAPGEEEEEEAAPHTAALRASTPEVADQIETALGRLTARWDEFQTRPSARRIAAFQAELERAIQESRRLRDRLTLPAEGAGAGRGEAGDGPLSSRAGEEASTAFGATRVPDLSQSLDEILWRINSDWQHSQRHPTPDRLALLRDELAEAVRQAQALLEAFGPRYPAEAHSREHTPEDERVEELMVVPFTPYRDQSTGLYNREGFDAVAGAELKKCRRYRRDFGFLLVQLSVSGLRELREAAVAIQQSLRESDILGRYVDRTFAVGLPETAEDPTRLVGGRVVESLRNAGLWGPSARIGVAGYAADGDTLTSIVNAARDRMENRPEDVLGRFLGGTR